MLKVWGRRSSVNVQKVMWAVAELGISHEHVQDYQQHVMIDWKQLKIPGA